MNCRNPRCEAPATRLKTAKGAIETSCKNRHRDRAALRQF
jgi:hypothetical protein